MTDGLSLTIVETRSSAAEAEMSLAYVSSVCGLPSAVPVYAAVCWRYSVESAETTAAFTNLGAPSTSLRKLQQLMALP